MKFTGENIWLKDYYTSRIQMKIKENQEGLVRLRVGDHNSSHLAIASEQDDSGLTPAKFQGDLEADIHELRNPTRALENSGFKHVLTHQTPPSFVSSTSRTMTEGFLDLLVCRENLDMMMIEA
jgi:hypothetical protein